jgi:putative transposase
VGAEQHDWIDGPFHTVDELELSTLSWVHWFNENRLHSSIRYLTPIKAEEQYYRETNPQSQPALGEPALH